MTHLFYAIHMDPAREHQPMHHHHMPFFRIRGFFVVSAAGDMQEKHNNKIHAQQNKNVNLEQEKNAHHYFGRVEYKLFT